MQPQMILMIVEPQDIIGELVKRRAADLQNKNPEFKTDFDTLEKKIKDHEGMLKQKEDMNRQLFDRVIQELEVREYNFKKEETSIVKQPRARQEKGWRNREFRESGQHTSNRSSEISEMAFRPYKVSNFSHQLTHLKLKSLQE